MFNTINGRRVLETNQMEKVAPSIFAEHESQHLSDLYKQIPTINIIELLGQHGWKPVQAMEQRIRTAHRRGFQKHMVRLANPNVPEVGLQTFPEILLTNAHDGSSSYRLHAGLFRMICSNGMVVCDGSFDSVRIRHMGFDEQDVISASYRVIDSVPKLAGKVNDFQQVQLTEGQRLAYGKAALELRWPEESGPAPVTADTLVNSTRRWDDRNPDLWSTFNVVQENLVRGGIRENRRSRRTREVKGIDSNTKLNKALWTLTEEMAKLATAS